MDRRTLRLMLAAALALGTVSATACEGSVDIEDDGGGNGGEDNGGEGNGGEDGGGVDVDVDATDGEGAGGEGEG
jgi:hypothetical protein